MKWMKKGFICSHETLNLPWFTKNTMVPVPWLMDDNRLRLFITMCDDTNVGRIGYIDVNPHNPSEILGHSKTPVLDIGQPGAFDDNGIITSSILEDDGKLYLYFSGYQLTVGVPYLIFSGVAVSTDNGETFTKHFGSAPMLDRIDAEVSTRCAPFVMKEPSGEYRMWYTADKGSGWITGYNNKLLPLYDLKTMTSSSPTDWPRKNGDTAITFKNEDEHGIAKCTFWKEDGLYKAIYSIRSLSQGYRLGYAESTDGVTFTRKDDQVNIDVSETGWDSEMIAFPERYSCMGKTYLFYCGNKYGQDGIGYAELMEE